MTLEDVRQAKQTLEGRGEYASADKILQVLKVGSKKTVLRYLRQLPGARTTGARVLIRTSAPVPDPDPVPPVPMVQDAAPEPWKRGRIGRPVDADDISAG